MRTMDFSDIVSPISHPLMSYVIECQGEDLCRWQVNLNTGQNTHDNSLKVSFKYTNEKVFKNDILLPKLYISSPDIDYLPSLYVLCHQGKIHVSKSASVSPIPETILYIHYTRNQATFIMFLFMKLDTRDTNLNYFCFLIAKVK